MMKKAVIMLMLMMMLLFVPSAFGLSDNEYGQMMNDSEFRAADSALNRAYRNAKNSLSASDFNALKKNQAQWIKSGRDNEAKRLLRTMSRVEAYTSVTLARAEYINGLTSSTQKSSPRKAKGNGQSALILGDTVQVYSRADRNSRSETLDAPSEWLTVFATIRDKNNDLWYRVEINGREAWIFQTGVRLKMGGKNSKVSNIYNLCTGVRRKVMAGTFKGWEKEEDGDTVTYTSRNGSFTVRDNYGNVEDIRYVAHGESTCTAFLGFNAIGMDRNALRKKLGSPTMRETPQNEPDVNILRYELPDRDMTLAMYLRRSRGKREAVVYRTELYAGETGDNIQDSGHDSAGDDLPGDLPNDTPNDDLPDDLPNDDLPDNMTNDTPNGELPDDVPGDLTDLPDEPKPQKPQPKKAAVSSQEQAQEIITDKLLELDEITPTETLDANGTTEIDGATCWEFISPVSYKQYAISPKGKIYVHDGDKYSPVK